MQPPVTYYTRSHTYCCQNTNFMILRTRLADFYSAIEKVLNFMSALTHDVPVAAMLSPLTRYVVHMHLPNLILISMHQYTQE